MHEKYEGLFITQARRKRGSWEHSYTGNKLMLDKEKAKLLAPSSLMFACIEAVKEQALAYGGKYTWMVAKLPPKGTEYSYAAWVGYINAEGVWYAAKQIIEEAGLTVEGRKPADKDYSDSTLRLSQAEASEVIQYIIRR
jgi:hypothetical protein